MQAAMMEEGAGRKLAARWHRPSGVVPKKKGFWHRACIGWHANNHERQAMDKRNLLRAGLAAAAAGVSAPALAQATAPAVLWRLASSFPKSLDTIYGGAEVLSRRLAAITGGRFQASVHAAGELMPAFGVVDAVQGGSVECAHTASYYFVGKNKAFGFETTLPFGLNQRQQNAWMYYGGGLQLVRE